MLPSAQARAAAAALDPELTYPFAAAAFPHSSAAAPPAWAQPAANGAPHLRAHAMHPGPRPRSGQWPPAGARISAAAQAPANLQQGAPLTAARPGPDPAAAAPGGARSGDRRSSGAGGGASHGAGSSRAGGAG